MQRFYGTATRQLVLIDEIDEIDEPKGPRAGGLGGRPAVPRLWLMQKDMYAELALRRRRAQIEARRRLRADEH